MKENLEIWLQENHPEVSEDFDGGIDLVDFVIEFYPHIFNEFQEKSHVEK